MKTGQIKYNGMIIFVITSREFSHPDNREQIQG